MWIVDPIDGTRKFILQIPELVISIAIAEQGEVILGVIHNPSTGELFEAVRGEQAKLNDKPTKSNHRSDDRPVFEANWSDIKKGQFAAFESAMEIRPCGSIAYKLARLAAGKADSVFNLTLKNEWDIAAGVILVTEAGGNVGSSFGRSFVFNQPDTLFNRVIAASNQAYDTICSIIDTVTKKKMADLDYTDTWINAVEASYSFLEDVLLVKLLEAGGLARLLRELIGFAKTNKAWWVVLIVILLLLLSLITIAVQTSAPFIYTLA